MAFGTLELTLRPLTLAFLVDPSDEKALVEAIQINTFLRGGMINPIIPVFRRLPAVSTEPFYGNLTAQTLITGYLDAFDPDFVVIVGNVASPKDLGFRKIIPSSQVLSDAEKNGTPKYGAALFELLDHFAQHELKFVRHDPLSIQLPKWNHDHESFFAAAFGALPEKLAEWFCKNYAHLPGLKWKSCSMDTFADFFQKENLFLRRLGSLHIERRPAQ